MTRAALAAAGVATLALVAPASATINPACTPDGVQLTWTGFRPGPHAVTYSIDGLVPVTRLVVENGTVTRVPLPNVAPWSTVTIRESWGPRTSESMTFSVTVRCEPVPPPPPPPPPVDTPPPTQEDSTPPPPAPPKKAKPTCAQLRKAGAGVRWLRLYGCVTPPKRCPRGTVRRVIRPDQGAPRVVCVRPTPRPRPTPTVTG